MLFCPNCNNILDITKNPPKNKNVGSETPSTISETEEKPSKRIDKSEDIAGAGAYYFCKNCAYSKAMESGTLILSKTNSRSVNSYMNMDKLKNKIYSNILPFTRNYICINKSCESHKDSSKREAVFYRLSDSTQVWYTCRACSNYWKGE